jgi:S1-C subfamily serine protease
MERLTPDQLFEAVADSVMTLRVDQGVGSGFYAGNGSMVITNAHVVGHCRKVKIHLRSGQTFDAPVIRSFREVDLAFVLTGTRVGKVQPLRSTATLKVGETVLAIGSPLGFEYSLTRGIVSAVNQTVVGRKFIQTDASAS